MKKRILVTEDDPQLLSLEARILRDLGYEVETAASGLEALSSIRKGFDLLMIDLVMPGIDGFEVIRRIRSDSAYDAMPIAVVTGLNNNDRRLESVLCGASDFIAKPIDFAELEIRVAALLKTADAKDAVVRYQEMEASKESEQTENLRRALNELTDLNRRMYKAHIDTLERLAKIAEFRHQDNSRHLSRVCLYSELLARGLGLPRDEVETIKYGSILHDVGKRAVETRILQKKGSLSVDERAEMEQHAGIGSEMLKDSDSALLQTGRIIEQSHHEKWDGSGYPEGLKGEAIPLAGRICAVADVFDALTSRRPYKEAFPVDVAKSILQEGRGSHFDPRVLDCFLEHFDEVKAILENEEPPALQPTQELFIRM